MSKKIATFSGLAGTEENFAPGLETTENCGKSFSSSMTTIR